MHMRVATLIFVTVAGIGLASCAQTDAESTPMALTEKQSKLLKKELDGKVPGEPVNCISDFNADNVIRVSDDILLFRASGRLVYQNKLRSSCPGLARDSDIMVFEQFGTQKCSGDIIKLVDRTSGIQGGFCSLGDFVPYRSK
jgi:hypothetical protein